MTRCDRFEKTFGEKKMRLLAIVAASFVLLAPIAVGQEIVVAAAADMSAVLPELVARYAGQTGQNVKLSFGSSGNLTNQIRNGAPFDVFFSADEDYPNQLITEGFAEKDTLYRYAVGRLVLWVPNDVAIDPQKLGINLLLDPSIKRISIANPEHAPYGRAAVAALKHFGIYEQIASKLVLGEDVSQATQFVESGNAQAGLTALSHALAPTFKDKGHYWVVPLDTYPALNQAAVVLSRSKSPAAAHEFLDFVRSAESATLLATYGFSLPAEKH